MNQLDRVRGEKPVRRQDTRKPAAQRPGTQAPGPRPRRKLDLDAVPEGYDANVWELTLFFQAQAEHYHHELAAGRPVIYAKLADRFEKSGVKQLRSHRGQPLKWVPAVKAIMMDFWDNEVWLPDVAHAIDQFCGVETFNALLLNLLRDFEAKQAKAAMSDQPKQPERSFRDTPAGQARMAARQHPQEVVPIAQRRAKEERPWSELREAVERIRERTAS